MGEYAVLPHKLFCDMSIGQQRIVDHVALFFFASTLGSNQSTNQSIDQSIRVPGLQVMAVSDEPILRAQAAKSIPGSLWADFCMCVCACMHMCGHFDWFETILHFVSTFRSTQSACQHQSARQ